MCRHGTNYKVGKEVHSKTDIAFNILMIGSTWRWLLHLKVHLDIPASNQNTPTYHLWMQTAGKSNEYFVHYNKKVLIFMWQQRTTASKNSMYQQNTNLYKYILMTVLQRIHTKMKETASKLHLSIWEYNPSRGYDLSESLGIKSVHQSSWT